MYFVYVLMSSKDKKFYTGFTRDLEKRIDEHNSGMSRATKNRVPFTLVYYEFCLNQKDAMKREIYLKTTWGKRYIKNRIKSYIDEIMKHT
jgi:putative endonuclease